MPCRQPGVWFKVGLFILLFIISAGVRLPNISTSLSDPYDTPTALVLVVLDVWSADGALKNKFLPRVTYPGQTNRYVLSSGVRLMNKEGIGYYTSSPPFSLILAYLVHRVLNMDATVVSMRLLNLVLGLIAALFFYEMMLLVLPTSEYRRKISLIGTVLFIFAAPHLWYFSQLYSWHIVWEYCWIATLYFVFRILSFEGKAGNIRRSLFYLGLANFLAVYSDFQGVLASLVIMSYACFVLGERPVAKGIFYSCCISTIAALIITIVQYSSISGFSGLIDALEHIAFFRSSLAAGTNFWLIVAYHYVSAYALLLLYVISLLLLIMLPKENRGRVYFDSKEKGFLYLTLLPVLIQHGLFLSWCAIHPSSILRAGVFICGSIVVLSNVFRRTPAGWELRNWEKILKNALIIVVLAYSVWQYYEKYGHAVQPGGFAVLGEEIRRKARNDEIVFMAPGRRVWMPLVYYSKRNIQGVSSDADAISWMITRNLHKGVVFHVNGDLIVEKISRVVADVKE
ncbi:MAG: hypothetical protein D6719_09950 [Candidatus Dadabacteria bacterium]|nr:MAG: hypothetical protein D6719_09950 [Candidatus Dadabacteria bacterium]